MKPSVEKENPGNPAALPLFMAVKNGLKNKWLSAQAVLVIGFVLQAGMAAAQQNLVTNPGFETGNTSGWFAFGSPTLSVETSQVHSGTYAAEVTGRTATYMGIAQSFVGVLQSGQTYNVSAWVMLVSGGNQTMQLTMQKIDGSGTSYGLFASGSVSTNGWTQLSGQYTYNPSGTVSALNLYAEVPSSSTASYYIDDVQLSAGTIVTNPPINGVSAVDWNNVHQRIDGFGASSAWNGNWNTAEADLLFSTNNNISYQSGTYNGVGLSLLRNHITYANTTLASDTPTTVETSIMQMAQARGALVWSTPWTPAAGFKSVNDIYDSGVATDSGIDGGSYLGSGNNITNVNYASQLANYVASMKTNYSVNLYAISVQNEPDADVTSYEACQWSGAQIHDFVTNLYSALAAQGLSSTKIIIPESEDWSGDTALFTPTLADPNAAADVAIIANHDYVADNSVGDQTVPAALNTSGKALWETEVALLSGSDSSIANGVYYAQRIYLYMTQAQANAYHYWWLVASGTGNEGLLDTSAAPTKRLFTFGQYSRFVRPNFYRIDATSSQPSALISAYKDSNSPAFAIVVVNTNAATDVIQTFNLTNFTAASVTPWITSASLSLAPQTPVNVTNFSFTYDVPAMSVVTFVGQNTPAPVTTTVSLTSGSNPSTYGNTVTFTATVQTNGVAVGGISGETVSFYDGTTLLGTGTLNSSGQAAYATSAAQLSATTHSIKAGYPGDATYAGSTNSPALSQTVNQATLTAGLTGTVSKTYDGTTTATLAAGNYTLSGVVSGDTVTLNNPTSGTYDTRNQGTGKTVTVTGLAISGASATNYTLASTSISAAIGTISQTNITVTATANTKTYDGTTSAAAIPTITSGSVQTGDTAGFAETYDISSVGTGKTLTPSGSVSDGNSGNNYNYTFIAGNGGTINALPVNLTGTRPYDGTTTAAAGILTVANKVGSDDVTVASGSGTVASPNIGTQAITSFGTLALGGTTAGNYTLSGASGYVTITAAGFTVTVTNLLALDKVYDGTTNATLDATNAGLVGVTNGDDVTLISSNAVGYFADKNVGTNKPVTVIGLTLGGAQATNYELIDPTNITANITPAGLAVSGVTAADKVYDGTTAATLTGTAVLSGQVVSNDDVSLVTSNATAFFADANVGTNKPVTVTGYALTGADAGNYTLAQPAGLTANILPLVTPTFGNPAIAAGAGGWQLSFGAQNGQNYKVLATTNLALPVNQWTIVTNGTFGAAGTATFTDSSATNLPQRFYIIVSP
jgi:O-glycosyl hydrolase